MKILIVHNFYQQPGGEDTAVNQEFELLKEHGEDVELYSAHNRDINDFGTRLFTFFTVTYNPLAKRELKKRLRSFRPDVVHVHNFFPMFSPSIFDACLEEGIPSVMTLHNFRILCPTAFLYPDSQLRERSLHHACWWTIPRRVYHNSFLGTLAVAIMVEFHKRRGSWQNRVDCFVVLTNFARAKFVEGGLPSRRIVVKGNSVPAGPLPMTDQFRPRHGALFVGRLSPEKGVVTLIDAWKKIDYPLTVVGDGPLLEWAKANASPNVTFAGRLSPEGVRAKMLDASFLIIPSEWSEMLPVTLLEAFSSGLPVIVSSLDSLKEIVVHNTNGRIFTIGNSASLADQVRWAIDHPDELQNLAKSGYDRWQRDFAPQANYNRLMEIYREVCERHTRRRQGRSFLA